MPEQRETTYTLEIKIELRTPTADADPCQRARIEYEVKARPGEWPYRNSVKVDTDDDVVATLIDDLFSLLLTERARFGLGGDE